MIEDKNFKRVLEASRGNYAAAVLLNYDSKLRKTVRLGHKLTNDNLDKLLSKALDFGETTENLKRRKKP